MTAPQLKATVTPFIRTEQPKMDYPEPQKLPSDLPPVQRLDYDWLPLLVRGYVQDVSERMNCPPDYVAVSVLAGLATVIGRKIGVRPQENTDWTEAANLWALVIGRPGVMKSPSMSAALKPVKALIARATSEFQQAEAQHKADALVKDMRAKAAQAQAQKALLKDPHAALDVSAFLLDEVETPTPRRYMVQDTTPEALLEVLRTNENGVMVYRDELVGLLKGMDREDRAEQRALFLTGWNGNDSFTSDRITRGLNLHVPAVCLSLLGATQPGKIASYVNQAVKGGDGDDGLLQRFSLVVWPDLQDYKEVDRQPDKDKARDIHHLFQYLDELQPQDVDAEQDTDHDGNPDGLPYLRFDADALEIFRDWRHDLEQRLRSDDLHPAFESHLSKFRKLVPSLAEILHLSAKGKGKIGRIPLLQALGFAGYFESHAQRLYASVNMPEVTAAKAILRRVTAGDLPDQFTARDVYRKKWSGLTDKADVETGLEMLVDYDWLIDSEELTGGKSKITYALNPRAA
jgi:putative DNA primase/helicase